MRLPLLAALALASCGPSESSEPSADASSGVSVGVPSAEFPAPVRADSSALAAPGTDPATPSRAQPRADSPDLTGVEWRLVRAEGRPVGDLLVTVTFTNEPVDVSHDLPGFTTLGGYDGCNEFWAAYRLDGDRLVVGMNGGTVRACPPPAGPISDAVRSGLGRGHRVRREASQVGGDRLVVTDSLGAERLAFQRRPVRPVDRAALTRGRWRSFAPADIPPHVVALDADGTYAGSAGCLSYRGDYAIDRDRLTVTSYFGDGSACPDGVPPDVGSLPLATGEVEASDARLVVYDRDGGRTVFARP